MTWIQSSVLAVTIALMAPVVVLAQKDEKDKVKKDVQQIIITRSGEKDEKVVVEINGDKVTVNGKPIDEFKDKDVKVRVNRLRDSEAFAYPRSPRGGTWNFNEDDNVRFLMLTQTGQYWVDHRKGRKKVQSE
jgi:serine protease Do